MVKTHFKGKYLYFHLALTLVYAKANSVVQADVEAPTWLHKFIIGRKGANIRQITQDLPKVRGADLGQESI